MATVHVVAVARDVTDQGIVPGSPVKLNLVVNLALYPIDGSNGITTGIVVSQDIATSAVNWRTAIINAIKAFAAAPVGSPDVYVIDRLIGLIDLATVATP